MMNSQGALREAQRLRVTMQMDNRLHLEVLAALSKTFRDNRQKISDGLLRSLVFAVPEELPGEGAFSKTAMRSLRFTQGSSIPPQPTSIRAPMIPPQPVSGIAKKKKKASKKGTKAKKSSKKSSKKR